MAQKGRKQHFGSLKVERPLTPLKKEMATHSSTLAWQIHGQWSLEATVHGVAKCWIQLNDFHFSVKSNVISHRS